MKADVVENFMLFMRISEGIPTAETAAAMERYSVNLLVDRSRDSRRPVIVEQNPIYENLFGKIEYRQLPGGGIETGVALIRGGSLHRANGGVLILRAADVVGQPMLWSFLKAALRDSEIRIEEFYREGSPPLAGAPRPVPVPLDIKVILVGSQSLYRGFFIHDAEFSADFKIHAQIDPNVDATRENLSRYAAVIAEYARTLNRSIRSEAMSRLLSLAARWATHRKPLTSSYELLCNLIEEASADDTGQVSREAVAAAVSARRRRNSQMEDEAQRAIRNKLTIIQVHGTTVGQVNGLTVQQLGDNAFGTPARITARSSVGRRGVISIERLVAMSGPIQQKGSMVLQDILARRFARTAPMSFDCSVTFEQLYGGVEGDSASMAEYLAIISDLADTPIRQDLAITGSVNQLGEAQVIGGVHHKIEGFYRTCRENGGLSGTQGVVVPAQNRDHLVLRDEVADAVEAGMFHVFTVNTVDEAVALFTGMNVGLGANGEVIADADSVYGRVLATLRDFDVALATRHL
ncbi:MAG: putative ATP-dependent protease [Gammaproteobacteria bacterium]|jgi:predicted ATP-dependent protease